MHQVEANGLLVCISLVRGRALQFINNNVRFAVRFAVRFITETT